MHYGLWTNIFIKPFKNAYGGQHHKENRERIFYFSIKFLKGKHQKKIDLKG